MAEDATVASDHISATTTYVVWGEERLWNVSVLQRAHLSSLVIYFDDDLITYKNGLRTRWFLYLSDYLRFTALSFIICIQLFFM
jgi:hypothetical protein